MADLFTELMALNDTPEVRDQYVRAPFGYPGAKSRSLSELLPKIPYRAGFCEPFGGTGCVLLARHSSNLEVYNDRHGGIVSLMRCARDPVKVKQLIERLEMTLCAREEFLWCRDTWDDNMLDDVERAARWYYAVQHSFNSKGWSFGRVVKGRAQCGKLFNNLKLFWPLHYRLRNVQIENMDWRLILKDYNNRDMVWYMDPPYWKTVGSYLHEFKETDHYELCERIQRLDGWVGLSGYDHPDHPYNKYKWDHKYSWDVQCSMTGMAFTDTNHLEGKQEDVQRGKATETLWVRDFAA